MCTNQRGQNLIEGNLVWSTKDAGIQLTSGAVIRNNIVISATDAGIYVSANQLENDYHDLQIVHNTVYGSLGQDLYLPVCPTPPFPPLLRHLTTILPQGPLRQPICDCQQPVPECNGIQSVCTDQHHLARQRLRFRFRPARYLPTRLVIITSHNHHVPYTAPSRHSPNLVHLS